MSLGENLQFIRKKNGITQEQFAEQLGVSRQSISKWESDASYPEMEKLLWICEQYHCNLDTLMRGNLENTSVEDTARYDEHMNSFSKSIALGVGLILFGVGTSSLLEGIGVSEYLGSACMLILIAIAVVIFIVSGLGHEGFQRRFPFVEQFYSEEQIFSFEKKFPVMIAAPIALIFVAVVFATIAEQLVIQTGISENVFDAVFMYLIMIAVTTLVYAGIQKSKYDIKAYNKETNPDPETKKANSRIGKWCGVIMLVATAIFVLSIGLDARGAVSGDFNWRDSYAVYSWVAFPIGGILCGIVSIILSHEGENKDIS